MAGSAVMQSACMSINKEIEGLRAKRMELRGDYVAKKTRVIDVDGEPVTITDYGKNIRVEGLRGVRSPKISDDEIRKQIRAKRKASEHREDPIISPQPSKDEAIKSRPETPKHKSQTVLRIKPTKVSLSHERLSQFLIAISDFTDLIECSWGDA